jgi:hypothetical protein
MSALSGCSELAFHESPGAAGIVVTFRQPQADPKAFYHQYENAPGVVQSDCREDGASFAFDRHAGAGKVGHRSLRLNRDPRVKSVLVRVVGSSGCDITRP